MSPPSRVDVPPLEPAAEAGRVGLAAEAGHTTGAGTTPPPGPSAEDGRLTELAVDAHHPRGGTLTTPAPSVPGHGPHDGLPSSATPHERVLRDAEFEASYARAYGEFCTPFPSEISAPIVSGHINNPCIDDSGYAASFHSVDESNKGYRSQRWEIKRQRNRARAPAPDPMQSPSSGFPPAEEQCAQRRALLKRLPPGVRRTRHCTYVTTREGKTAIYYRKPRVFAEWEHDDDGNECNAVEELVWPDQSDFESDPDEEVYTLSIISGTSDFSFTAHPEDYQEYGGVEDPPRIINRDTTHAEEMNDAWPDSSVSLDQNLSGEQYDQRRDAVLSLAEHVDSSLAHIRELYRRNRLVTERVTDTRDALCRHNDLTMQACREIWTLADNLTDRHIQSTTITQVESMIQSALHSHRQEMEAHISQVIAAAVAELQVGVVPEPTKVSALGSLERSIKKRLSDHAARLTEDLTRRRSRPSTPVLPTRGPGPSGVKMLQVRNRT